VGKQTNPQPPRTDPKLIVCFGPEGLANFFDYKIVSVPKRPRLGDTIFRNFHYPFGSTSAYANICRLPSWPKRGPLFGPNYSTVGQRFSFIWLKQSESNLHAFRRKMKRAPPLKCLWARTAKCVRMRMMMMSMV